MIVVGVDEAGIGCWAGPLVVVSAAFDTGTDLPDLIRDSKRLSESQRESLIDDIYGLAEWVIIKTAPPSYINASSGIWAVWYELVEELLVANQDRSSGKIIVDGVKMISSVKGVHYEAKADAKYREVSAASIVAKYVQTCAMEDLDDQFSKYGFKDHHGYGTAVHSRMLWYHGPTPAHRLSYKPVAEYLERHPAVKHELSQLMMFGGSPTTTVISSADKRRGT
jgi:ribonuclease HII